MKRIIDIVAATFVLIACAPLLLLIAILVRVNLGSPVLFKQMRPGLFGKSFVMFKFRTMREAVDKQGNALPDNMRLTNFGKFLRSSSVDELPELWNVIIGDMSLVGPRPLLMEYLPLYNSKQATRHEVRPGITGWAQVNGRNAISWEDKFKLDVWYVEHANFLLDLKILLLTIGKLLKRHGISKNGHATTDYFQGNK